MHKLIAKLGISEKFTKRIRKPKHAFNKTDDMLVREADKNHQADLLQLPKTKEGYQYMLVIVDLWSREVDFEPLKDKSSATVKEAFKTIFKRPYLNAPVMVKTDNGTEFKGEADKYLKKEGVWHRTGHPYRHQNQANVERMNRTIGRLLNGYMNAKEEATGKVYREWTDVLDIIRTDLNKMRYRADQPDYVPTLDVSTTPKFKVGDLVHRKLDYPQNALGHKQPTENFRVGDYRFERHPKEIISVFPYPKGKQPGFRYMLRDILDTSYAEWELMKSKDQVAKYVVERLLAKKRVRGKTFYKVKWRGFSKQYNSWEPEETLMEDVPDLVEAY